jgi:hypothetical protein
LLLALGTSVLTPGGAESPWTDRGIARLALDVAGVLCTVAAAWVVGAVPAETRSVALCATTLEWPRAQGGSGSTVLCPVGRRSFDCVPRDRALFERSFQCRMMPAAYSRVSVVPPHPPPHTHTSFATPRPQMASWRRVDVRSCVHRGCCDQPRHLPCLLRRLHPTQYAPAWPPALPSAHRGPGRTPACRRCPAGVADASPGGCCATCHARVPRVVGGPLPAAATGWGGQPYAQRQLPSGQCRGAYAPTLTSASLCLPLHVGVLCMHAVGHPSLHHVGHWVFRTPHTCSSSSYRLLREPALCMPPVHAPCVRTSVCTCF